MVSLQLFKTSAQLLIFVINLVSGPVVLLGRRAGSGLMQKHFLPTPEGGGADVQFAGQLVETAPADQKFDRAPTKLWRMSTSFLSLLYGIYCIILFPYYQGHL